MELVKETDWSLHYSDENLGLKVVQSKFADGSANITLLELKSSWPKWTPEERSDFCHAINEATFDYLPDIYRYLIEKGDITTDYESLGAVAAWVVRKLPKEETEQWILKACELCPIGKGTKFFQALELTESKETIPTLLYCLDNIWGDPKLLGGDDYYDEPAHDATSCMECLLRLGYKSPDLEEKYNMLINHNITVNKQDAVDRLSRYFEESE